VLAASVGQFVLKGSEVCLIGCPQGTGIDKLGMGLVFQRTKHGSLLKRKIELILIQDLENDHVLIVAAKKGQSPHERVDVSEAIREEDEDSATTDLMQYVLQYLRQVGFLAGHGFSKAIQEDVQMVGARPRRNRVSNGRIKRGKTDRILLRDEQIGKACGEFDGVFMLRESLGARACVLHRSALIEYQRTTQIGLIFVLANVESIGFAKEFPIDASDFVAGNVGTMFFELDAGSDQAGSMDTAADSFDDFARKELQLRETRDVFGSKPTKE
jgi:hypothetical protein